MKLNIAVKWNTKPFANKKFKNYTGKNGHVSFTTIHWGVVFRFFLKKKINVGTTASVEGKFNLDFSGYNHSTHVYKALYNWTLYGKKGEGKKISLHFAFQNCLKDRCCKSVFSSTLWTILNLVLVIEYALTFWRFLYYKQELCYLTRNSLFSTRKF